MMHGPPDRTVNLLAIPAVASHPQRPLSIAYSPASRFHTSPLARLRHHARPMIGQSFRNRFPNPHRSARDHHNLSFKFHDVLLFSPVAEVKREVTRER